MIHLKNGQLKLLSSTVYLDCGKGGNVGLTDIVPREIAKVLKNQIVDIYIEAEEEPSLADDLLEATDRFNEL